MIPFFWVKQTTRTRFFVNSAFAAPHPVMSSTARKLLQQKRVEQEGYSIEVRG